MWAARNPKNVWPLCFVVLVTAIAWWISDLRAHRLLLETARLAACSIFIAIPIGSLLAWLLIRTDLPHRRLLGCLLFGTVTIPLYLQAAAWNAGFGQQGWWQLQTVGLAGAPLLSGFRGAAIVHGLAAIPWVAFIVGANLWLAAADQEEAALLDSSPWYVVTRISAPQAGIAAMVAALWIAVTVAGEITVTDLYQVRTYAEELYIGFAIDPLEETGDLSPATLGAVPGILLLGGLAISVFLVGATIWPRQNGVSLDAATRPFRLGRWRWPVWCVVLLTLFLLIDVPLLNLVYKCGVSVDLVDGERVRGWSFLKSCQLILRAPWEFRTELGWSLAISQLSSLAACLISFPLAWWVQTNRVRNRGSLGNSLVGIIAALFVAIPGPLLGLGLIRLLQDNSSPIAAWLYSNSIFVPTMVLAMKAWPIVLLIAISAFARVGIESLETARISGASNLRQLFSVAIPQQLPMLTAAWLVGVIVALGDVAASILTMPPGVTTVAIRIFGLMHYGVEDRLAAICLAMIGIIAILAGVVGTIWWSEIRMNRRRGVRLSQKQR